MLSKIIVGCSRVFSSAKPLKSAIGSFSRMFKCCINQLFFKFQSWLRRLPDI